MPETDPSATLSNPAADDVVEALLASFESADEALFVEDLEGRILRVNRAAESLFGHPRGELAGMDVAGLLPPESREALPRVVRQLEQEGAFDLEAWQRRADGTRFLARIQGVLHPTTLGPRVVVSVRDVTAARAETEALADRARELEAFLHTVAHDLRGPMGSLRGHADLLARELEGDSSRVAQMCGRLRSQAERLGHLLDDLLGFARIAGDPPEPADLDVAVSARAVWEDLSPRVREAELQVREPLARVRIAPVRLHQVLLNLFTNALKYRDPSRPCRVSVGCLSDPRAFGISEDMVCLIVADNGVGVRPSDRDHIFELFRQGTDAREGTGVGLAIVRRIVEAEGGRVWVDGAPGAGSRFHFTLPRGAHG